MSELVGDKNTLVWDFHHILSPTASLKDYTCISQPLYNYHNIVMDAVTAAADLRDLLVVHSNADKQVSTLGKCSYC